DNVLRAMPQLKLIQLVSAGFDQMNLALCQELGVPIANNGGANSIDVAEHTIAMMLAIYRRFRQLDVNVRNNQWRAIDTGVCTYTIDGKTVGIIGMGNIGQKVARRLQGWGARVIYYDAYPPAAAVEQALNVTRVTLDELVAEADLITLHTPLNAETRGILSHAQFARMKPNTVVVNTCRGPVMDEAALIQALQNGQIAGAALDVLEKEPPAPDNPLLQMDNVLFTPH
ncbi:MAG: NAD(P)-binding domain-containing protein, partial [Caldilineaceae bacterium]|nr:NAD(P)-binding domain-containing protein [Caldilineaceae bacterium]